MTPIGLLALGAAMVLAACTSPNITSRLDSRDTLFLGFDDAESYTPHPIGGRAENDFMRFSAMSMAR